MDSKDKPKILFLVTKSNWGGAQRYVFDIASNLPPARYDIAVAFGGTGSVGAGAGALAEKLAVVGIRTIFLKHLARDVSVFSDIRAFFEILSLVRRERPNVVHLNSSKIGALGVLAVFIYNVLLQTTNYKLQARTVFTAHGFAENEDRPLRQKLPIALISWLTIFLSAKTIVITRREYARVSRRPFIKHKLALIHNGIGDIDFMDRDEARAMLTEKYGVPEHTLWLGTISELHKNKGLEYALRAFHHLRHRDISFVIMGDGEERARLQKIIESNGLAGKVFLVGFVKDAARYLPAFDIFTLTSLKEGLPYVLLEAGLAGLPIAATDIGGVPDIVGEKGPGVLVPPANAEETARALRALLDDSENRAVLGAALRSRVSTRFSLSKMLAETVRLYEV